MTQTPIRVAAVEARREAILDAAKAVFFEAGYALASMDRIAEVAGVTKRTVYAHFESKDRLFATVVDHGCRNVSERLAVLEAQPADPAEGLPRLLHAAREIVASPGCIRLERVVAAEAERHPQFAARLREALASGEALMGRVLDRWVAAGRLKPHDTAVSARLLNDQVGCATSFRGLLDDPHDAVGDAAIDAAVRQFLAVHATAP